MWWPFKKRPKPDVGADKLVEMLTEQCCNWFEIPHQVPPKVMIFDTSDRKAIYDIKSDTIFVYGSENITERILAHEVAHAVVVRCRGNLSQRMHEILAGYAEFKITKVFKG